MSPLLNPTAHIPRQQTELETKVAVQILRRAMRRLHVAVAGWLRDLPAFPLRPPAAVRAVEAAWKRPCARRGFAAAGALAYAGATSKLEDGRGRTRHP